MKHLRNKGIQIFVLSAVIAVVSNSCRTTRDTFDSKDLSYLYNPLKNSINPRYSFLNQADDAQSILSVKLMSNELFFSEANPSGVPMAMLLISVRLFNTTQGMILADTALYDIDITKDASREEYLYKFPLKVEKGNEYVADIKLMDKLRQMMVQSFVPFSTTSSFSRYNFFVRGHLLKNEISRPIVKKGQFFNIVYSRSGLDSLLISFYKPYEEFPYPPSMVLPEKPGATEPDTTIVLAYSDTLSLMFPNKGIYYCRAGRDIAEGFTVLNFGEEFPQMNKPEVMIQPLAYLASPDELDELRTSSKPKVALDNFWIECGGNVEKARELIRIFYTRVLYANYYFTSFKEGWRTDRGMIYIIYGPPDKLYKSNDEESWGYKKPPVVSRWGTRYQTKDDYLYFTFKKRTSRFSDNEYSLSRSETVITYWDQAVLAWRKGIVFRLDNPSDI
jgi:GWxTD domain-containing protein